MGEKAIFARRDDERESHTVAVVREFFDDYYIIQFFVVEILQNNLRGAMNEINSAIFEKLNKKINMTISFVQREEVYGHQNCMVSSCNMTEMIE